MNKLKFVEAHFKPLYKDVMVEVATGETKKGVFGKEKPVTRKEKQRQQTGWSDCRVDGPRLAIDVQKAIDELNAENYEIIGVTDITSGGYRYQYDSSGISSTRRVMSETEKVSGGGSYGYGYGFSHTEGVLIVARKGTREQGWDKPGRNAS